VLAQLAKANPVAQRNLGGVFELHAPLQGRIHQRHAAKGPQGQTAQAVARVAVHQRHALARLQAFKRRDQAGQAAANHQHIRLHCCCQDLSPRAFISCVWPVINAGLVGCNDSGI
jgi:hypothetical protein